MRFILAVYLLIGSACYWAYNNPGHGIGYDSEKTEVSADER